MKRKKDGTGKKSRDETKKEERKTNNFHKEIDKVGSFAITGSA